MSLKSIEHRRRRTVTFRLTVWYCTVFAVLAFGVFAMIYASLELNLKRRARRDAADDVTEFAGLYRRQGVERLQAELDREATSDGVGKEYLVLYGPDMTVRAASDSTHWRDTQIVPNDIPERPDGTDHFRRLRLPGFSSPVLAVARRLPDGCILQVVQSLEADARLLASYRRTFSVGITIMLLAGGFLGWLFARRAMAGVERITRTAWRIGAGDLKQRVPVGDEGEEIHQMADAFNQMLERIEKLVNELREVTNNIAHDLRSPITRIRGHVETMFTRARSLEECRESAGTVIAECDRMAHLINTMLDIAETEAGAAALAREPVSLRDLLEDVCDLFRPAAEDAGLTLELTGADGDPLAVTGDAARLQRAFANLLDNAVKFTPAEGAVRVSAVPIGEWVHISIVDTGIGIDPDHLAHVFDRFYRADASRSAPGSGLGLSLVRAVVEAHGGTVVVVSRPGEGSTFTVRLRACS